MIMILREKKSSFFNSYIGICIAILCFCGSAYSQNNAEDVSVELKTDTTIVEKKDTLTFCINVINNSQRNLYLVAEENPRPSYNSSTKELGFGLDIQTTNLHYFEFPKLQKLKPKSRTELKINIPVSSWKTIELGKWTVISSIGVLDEIKLKNKLKQLGFSIKDNIQMTAMDFLELQSVFYSNKIQFDVLDK